jgi:hypothetical protein
MSVKSGQQNDTDEINTIEEFSGDDSQIEISVTQKISEFLAKQKIDEDQPSFYLYKYDDYRTGEGKSLINKYRDCDPPDEDDIGKEFGSGRYLLVMAIPRQLNGKGLMRAYRFRVHPRYDSFIQKQKVLEPVREIQTQVVQSGPTFNDAFGMIERVLSIVSPLLNRPRDENVQNVLTQSYSTMGEMMKKSLMDQFRMMSELQKTMLIPGETMPTTTIEEEREVSPSILETLGPLLTEWLPKLLGGGPQAQVVQAAVKHSPQFQQILKDKVELNKIISYLKETQGEEKTDQILAALNIVKGQKQKQVVKK